MLLQIAERLVEPDITVVELSGKLALGQESQRIEDLIEELIQKGSKRIVLDMSGVEHIDSAGIGMVALAAGKLREVGGKLAVVAAGGRVLHLLTLTQMSTIVTVCPTADAGVAAV
jgi:anti-sigma B factor antagonist